MHNVQNLSFVASSKSSIIDATEPYKLILRANQAAMLELQNLYKLATCA
ncbi:MAG: hypothetical protein QMO91_06975 [Candidatus Tisiphia sp.]|nr:hypothetical protein [Candidatus Tisiphia sp.]